MAEKRTIELEVKESGLDQVTEKTKSLKQQLKEMKEQLGTMDEGSEGFKELVAEAGKLQDKIGDLNQQVKNFASDTGKIDSALGGISAVAGGFEAVQGAMGLVGSENQNLQKSMLKVQSAMALANGVQQVQTALQKESAFMKGVDSVKTFALATATGVYTAVVGTSTGAMKLFKLAMAGTGIGLLIAGVVALVSAFDVLSTPIDYVIGLLKDFGDWIGLTSFAEDEAHDKRLKQGEERTKQIEEQIKTFEKLNEKKLKAYTKEDDAIGRQIALAKAQGKDTYELEKLRLKASISFQTNLQNETYQQYQQIKASQKAQVQLLEHMKAVDPATFRATNMQEVLNKLKENENKIAGENQTAQKAILDAKNDLAILEIEHAKTESENAKKRTEDGKKQVKEVKDISREIEDSKLKALADGQEKELELNRVQYERKKLDLEKQVKEKTLSSKQANELIAQDVINQEIEAQKIRDKYAKEKIKREDEQWLASQKLALSAREYEELLLAQKFDEEQAKAEGNAELQTQLLTQHQTELKDLRLKFSAEDLKIAQDLAQAKLDAEKHFNTIVLSEDQLALIAIQEKNDSELLLLQTSLDNKLITQEQFEQAKIALTTKTNEEVAKLDEEADKKKSELLGRQLDAVKGGLSSIANIAELFAGKSKASQKRAFNIQKATNIATATIDTFTSAQSAYKSVIGIPVVGPVLAPLASAGAIAMGIMNIKKIKESQFEGGAEPSAGGGGGGGIGGAPQAPQFNVVGNNGMNQLAQLQQKPVQAFVVSSEMTSAQALERNRINNATI